MSLLHRLFSGKTISETILDGVLPLSGKAESGCVVAWIGGLAGRATADVWISTAGGQFFERRTLDLPIGRVDALRKATGVDNMADVMSRLTAFEGRHFHGDVRDGEILRVCYRTPSGQAKIDARGYRQHPEFSALATFLRNEGDKCADASKGLDG